jgi:hypothetical protein
MFGMDPVGNAGFKEKLKVRSGIELTLFPTKKEDPVCLKLSI